MKAFLDAGPRVARVNKRDPDHDNVVEFLNQMARGVLPYRVLVTTNYVVDEAVTFVLMSTKRHDLAVDLLDLLESSTVIQLEWITPEREDLARSLFRKLTDKQFSFTDVTSFVVMRELHITDALTLDQHFQQFGFKKLLP
ncbi:MAG: type II toxin-antitoxin system VapC family toxin [Candidatus Hodarchaeales archaeon]|jgi:predicted nucleic acid-binding protein